MVGSYSTSDLQSRKKQPSTVSRSILESLRRLHADVNISSSVKIGNC